MGRFVASLIMALGSASPAAAAPADVPSVQQDEGGGDDLNYTPATPPTAAPPQRTVAGAGTGTLLAGRTLMRGDAVVAEFGWPGFTVEYLHAQTHTVDVGGEFTFNYGREGLVEVNPGVKLQGALRLTLFDTGKLNFGLRLDPGLALYFDEEHGEGTAFGVTLPAALALGISAGDALMLNFGMDVPLFFRITPTDAFRVELPFLFGVGVEYRIDSHLSMLFDCRFGPDVLIYSDHTDAEFAFRALLGIGYRI